MLSILFLFLSKLEFIAQEKPLLVLGKSTNTQKKHIIRAEELATVVSGYSDELVESNIHSVYGKIVGVKDSSVLVLARWEKTEITFRNEETATFSKVFSDSFPVEERMISIPLKGILLIRSGKDGKFERTISKVSGVIFLSGIFYTMINAYATKGEEVNPRQKAVSKGLLVVGAAGILTTITTGLCRSFRTYKIQSADENPKPRRWNVALAK